MMVVTSSSLPVPTVAVITPTNLARILRAMVISHVSSPKLILICTLEVLQELQALRLLELSPLDLAQAKVKPISVFHMLLLNKLRKNSVKCIDDIFLLCGLKYFPKIQSMTHCRITILEL